MSVNRGKQFEDIVKSAFASVEDVSIDRLHDQTTGFAGSKNICDFIVYKEPNEYYIECKSIHGNTFPFSNVTDRQWQGLLEKAQIKGVFAGVLCWWVDKDVTRFMQITELDTLKQNGHKSVRYDKDIGYLIKGKKKRVFFEYDMGDFLCHARDVIL